MLVLVVILHVSPPAKSLVAHPAPELLAPLVLVVVVPNQAVPHGAPVPTESKAVSQIRVFLSITTQSLRSIKHCHGLALLNKQIPYNTVRSCSMLCIYESASLVDRLAWMIKIAEGYYSESANWIS